MFPKEQGGGNPDLHLTENGADYRQESLSIDGEVTCQPTSKKKNVWLGWVQTQATWTGKANSNEGQCEVSSVQ